MIRVPLFSAADAAAGVDVASAVQRVVNSHWYVLGKEVSEFEREFSDYCGVSHCIALASGTDALELALRSVRVGVGDRVALVSNAGFYGSTAVRLIGAVPVYADVDPRTLTLAPAALHEILKDGAKAIIVTHLYGQLADMATIVELAAEFDVPVIEDCAQAHGATRNGKRAGSFGAVGCFSFYPTKNLGALGDGGAVTTSRPDVAAGVRQLRQYGWGTKYRVEMTGGRNSRLDEMQAAVLRAKLPHLDTWNAMRRSIARRYNESFADLPVRCPLSIGEDYVAHLYVLRVADRERFRHVLDDQGIASDIHYPVPDHRQPAYAYGDPNATFPVTEEACNSVVSLPCFPGMSSEQVDRVIEAVKLAIR